MLLPILLAFVLSLPPTASSLRERYSIDTNFLFNLGEAPGYIGCSANTSFSLPLDGVEGSGLQPMGVVEDEDACMSLCCSNAACQLYNYCPIDSVGGCSGSAPSTCWIGSLSGVLQNNTKWKGRGRWSLQPPPPSTTGPQTLNYEDSSWRALSIPHDYVLQGNYTNTSSLEGHGYLSSGVAWYRRHLVLNSSTMQGQALWVDIDGAYRATDVWLNGAYLGHHESGYTSFRFYLHNVTDPFTGAPAIRWDQDNVLAFRMDGRDFEGWWYEGSGLYRHMWLSHTSPLFIVPWSIFAPSFVVGDVAAPQGPTGPVNSPGGAILHVSVDLYNDPSVAVSAPGVAVAAVNASLLLTLRDGPTGAVIATLTTPSQILAPGNWSRVRAVMNISGPLPLWCLADPHLVTLTVAVVEQAGDGVGGGVVVGGGDADAETITMGIRRAVFDARRGFLLNDQPTPIRGFCNHQDFGGCGVALPDRVNAFKVSTLKGIGSNAWRTSHNPVNPELMVEFDTQGMLALVELRHFVDTPGYLEEVRDMVLRDRNHPSIIAWSLCNEAGCGVWGGEEALQTAATTGAHFKDTILQADPSRPVTAAVRGDNIPATSDPWMRGVVSVVDVMGINYSPFLAAQWTQLRPFQPTLGTEQGSCQSNRATLDFDAELGYVGEAFNAHCTPTNGQAVAQGGFYSGSFDWTGFDYRGEPNPLTWPDIGSHFGVFDSAGFPKAGATYYAGWWGVTPGAVVVFPHWSRPPSDVGKTITLTVYAAAAACQLFVNGVPQGEGGGAPLAMPVLGLLQWSVVYQPGNVTAVCMNEGGAVVGVGSSITAGPPATLRLHLDAPGAAGEGGGGIAGDGADVALLSVSVHDAAGVLVPATPPVPAPLISFIVTGDGALYGLANGDPASHEQDKNSTTRTAFGGLVRAIVQAGNTRGKGGMIQVSVSAPGLTGDTLEVPVRGVNPLILE